MQSSCEIEGDGEIERTLNEFVSISKTGEALLQFSLSGRIQVKYNK